MNEMDNEDRAERAREALEGYLGDDVERRELLRITHDDDIQFEVTDEVIRDLICDLHHLADRTGVDMEQAFESGRGRYGEELAEEAMLRVGNVAQFPEGDS